MPTFRRPVALRESLLALIDQDYPIGSFEVIVVDDDGDAVASELVKGLPVGGPAIRVESQVRCGAAAARNRGARVAVGDMLLFIDDDIVVSPDHLARHAKTHHAADRTLVNGAWEFSPVVFARLQATAFGRFRIDLERHFQEQAMGSHIHDGIVSMPMLGSWNLSLARELFWEIDGFDEDFPVAGAEDQDFSLRARRAGCELWLDTKIVCLHNDDRLDLLAYCAREERSAQTMPVIARKFPDEFAGSAYVNENRPMRADDTAALKIKKAVKAALATPAMLAGLHVGVRAAERCRLPDAVLRRAYTAMLGLHLYRGFRKTWRGGT
jgi:glycosyltransferase involved in cell wall biosynthesis